ncbi:MAG: hypothetical protein RML95_03235 [Anaerolineae bacterium]|nr:hypothetical protein [Anaerolineae bacterium]
MSHVALVQRVVNALIRTELTGVNAHTLAVALQRAEAAGVDFEALSERGLALVLLQYCGYPTSLQELSVFLGTPHTLTPSMLVSTLISDDQAVNYVRWLPAFLEDMDVPLQRNSRTMLRWVVADRAAAIAAQQASLDRLRRLADDSSTSPKLSALLVYALGKCGTLEEDYDRVIRHAEIVIAHDRENLDLVAEALYAMYPPALINALQYFLEQTDGTLNRQQLNTGLILLAKVAEIEDRTFWQTYHEPMSHLVDQLSALGNRHTAIMRLLDQVEKQLAYAAYNADED